LDFDFIKLLIQLILKNSRRSKKQSLTKARRNELDERGIAFIRYK